MNQTQQNLLKAFAGESSARNKYTTFAKVARKQGYEWIARVFEETAENERVHAEELFELIKEPVRAPSELAIGPFETTSDNLKMAAEGEKFEWETMYPGFAKKAKEEGFSEVKRVFTEIGEVEEKHRDRYLKLKKNIEDRTVFKRDTEVLWKCRNCGYIHKGKEAPSVCPACAHAQSYYEIFCQPY